MMKRLSAPLVLLPFLAALAAAQNVQTVYFSSRFTEVPVSGRTGDINSNGASCVPTPTFNPPFNTVESGVINAPGVGYVEPGIPNVTVYGSSPALPATDFVEIFNFPQLNLYLGDADGDGVQNEGSSGSNFAGVDEIWIPASLIAQGRHNTMHEMFISSWSDAPGTQGYAGAAITEADMVLYPAAANGYPAPSTPGTPVFFIRQADWEAFFGLAAPSNGIDVDGFTVDGSNGDIYASFDAAIAGVQLRTAPGAAPVAMTLHQGAIVRIPGTAYTPAGPFGAVSLPLGGQAGSRPHRHPGPRDGHERRRRHHRRLGHGCPGPQRRCRGGNLRGAVGLHDGAPLLRRGQPWRNGGRDHPERHGHGHLLDPGRRHVRDHQWCRHEPPEQRRHARHLVPRKSRPRRSSPTGEMLIAHDLHPRRGVVLAPPGIANPTVSLCSHISRMKS